MLSLDINGASAVTIRGAAHFMIAIHADEIGQLIARHVLDSEALRAAA